MLKDGRRTSCLIPEEFVEIFLEITVFPLAMVVVGEAVMSSPSPALLPLSLLCTPPLFPYSKNTHFSVDQGVSHLIKNKATHILFLMYKAL